MKVYLSKVVNQSLQNWSFNEQPTELRLRIYLLGINVLSAAHYEFYGRSD